MHNISLCSCFVSHHCQKGFWALRSGCLNNQLRFWWECRESLSLGTPRTELCPRASPSSQDVFFQAHTKLSCFFSSMCLPTFGFLAVTGEFCSAAPPRCSTLQEKGLYLQTQVHSHIALPIFHLVHLLVDNHLWREIHILRTLRILVTHKYQRVCGFEQCREWIVLTAQQRSCKLYSRTG